MDFTKLFKEFHRPMRRWLRYDHHVPLLWIDDLASEVFERLMRYESAIEGVEDLQGYLYRTAMNVANEWRSKAAQRYRHTSDALTTLENQTDLEWDSVALVHASEVPVAALNCQPEHQYETCNTLQAIERAIDNLTERQQICFRLHVFEDLSYNKIAELNGWTYRLVLRELTKAYSGLRMQLRNTDLTDVWQCTALQVHTEVQREYNFKHRRDKRPSKSKSKSKPKFSKETLE